MGTDLGVDIRIGMGSRVGVVVEVAAVLQDPVTMAKRARKTTRAESSISLVVCIQHLP